MSGRDATRGAEVAALSGGVFVGADLDGSPAASEALAQAANGALGRVDILVNNAASIRVVPTSPSTASGSTACTR